MDQTVTLKERLKEEVRRARMKVGDLHKSRSSAFEASPVAGVVFDESLDIVDCNLASVDYFGYGTKDEFVDNAREFIDSVKVTSGDDGGETLRERLSAMAASDRDRFEAKLGLYDGREIPMQIILQKIDADSGYNIALYYQDVSSQKRESAEAATNEKLLKAVNKISSMLMRASAQAFPAIMKRALEVIAKSIGSERATVWRKGRRDATELVPVYSWEGEGRSLGERPIEKSIIHVPSWMPQLRRGEIIYATHESTKGPEREILKDRGAVAMLFVPVCVSERFWGVITLECCDRVCSLHAVDRSVLNNCSLLIASAIMRNKMATDLIDAKKAALQSAEAKSNFLANMSHEIRTPMNAILGMTAIARGAKGDITRIEDCLAKIEAASRQMMSVISDVLDMSRMEMRTFTIDRMPFSFREMLQGIIDANMVRFGERHQRILTTVDRDLHDRFYGDPIRLAQVLNNLLSNASKFSKYGDIINVDVNSIEKRESQSIVRIAVTDSGIGITKEQMAHIFEPFHQADASLTRKFEGSGLGLPIAHNIIGLMGGEIYVDSEPGRGSKFWFELTLEHCDETLAQIDDADDGGEDGAYVEYDFSGKKIMVVDDIEINREIVATLMEETGAEIIHAEDGAESVEKFKKDPSIDLIFMDIHMPVMDGLEATRQIRTCGAPNAETVPIVALTANALADDAEICAAAGMNGHIAKPIDPGMLMEKTYTYVSGKRIRKKIREE